MQTTVKNIQLLPALTHVNSDGSAIGGVDPVSYNYEILNTSLFMYTAGAKTPGYPAWMWYPAEPLPLQQSATKINLELEFILGGNIEALNAIETDIIIVAPNAAGVMQKYNRSAQYVQGKGFQIADAAGNWVDVGVNPGPLRAYSTYNFKYEHTLSSSGGVSSTAAVSMNGVKSLFAQQPVQGQPTTWNPAGIYVQVQQGSLPSAAPWTLKIKKLTVTQS